MTAADTSAWIDFASGARTPAADALEVALLSDILVLPPVVLVEILSGPKIRPEAEERIRMLRRLDLLPGYW